VDQPLREQSKDKRQLVTGTSTFFVYGLVVRSQLASAALRGCSSNIPCRSGLTSISFGPEIAIIPRRIEASTLSGQQYGFSFGSARLRVTNGQLIEVQHNGVPVEQLRAALNLALAAALSQRGFCLLHGAALAINGKAAIFIAPRGSGKSTLSAYAATHPDVELLADDVCALEPGTLALRPGPAVSNLCPDTIVELKGEHAPATMPRVWNDHDKRALIAPRHASDKSYEVCAIYEISPGARLAIERQEGARAFHVLLKNSYYGQMITATGQNENHFENCVQLAKRPGVSRLHTIHDYARLPELLELIRCDMATR
jgi:hypothetical protein